MAIKEKRKNIRIDSLNLLEVSVVENQIVVYRGFARTLNVSESGILLETHFAIDVKDSLSMTIAIENDLVHINGKAVYCRPRKDELFETGVQFIDLNDSAMKIIRKLVKVFNEKK